MEDDKKLCPLKDKCWCVSFSLNDEIQDDVCFFDSDDIEDVDEWLGGTHSFPDGIWQNIFERDK